MRLTWLRAIKEAFKEHQVKFPSFIETGMGRAFCINSDGRFVSFRCRLVPADIANIEGVEWSLGFEEEFVYNIAVTFREPIIPSSDRITAVFSIIQGWLIDKWTIQKIQTIVTNMKRDIKITK